MGFEEEEVREVLQKLIKWKMLIYDGEDIQRPVDRDLLKITPSGYIHLRSLPHFIEYISSVAILAPIRDQAVSRRIPDIWDCAVSRAETYP